VIYAACLALAACQSKSKPEPKPDAPKPALQALENPSAPLPDKPLAAGDKVFDFSALAHTGQRFHLSEFLDRPVLVYFCPSDATPQCSQLALNLRDHWLLLNPSLSMAFGVSADDTFVHRDFASEHELPHLLLADGDQTVHRLFGLQLGALTAYLVGTDRTILRVLSPVDGEHFAEQVKAALAELGLERPVPPI
jgi:peroxiredoxin Q/BCP